MALTAAERQKKRREKIKADKEKYKEYLENAKQRYHSKKTLVADLDERNKRLKRRKDRVYMAKYRREKKELLASDEKPSMNSQSSTGRARLRRDRTKLFKENVRLQKIALLWKRRYETVRKRNQRQNTMLQKYDSLCKAMRLQYKNCRTFKEKHFLKNCINLIDSPSLKKSVRAEALGIKRFRIQSRKNGHNFLRNKVTQFFLREDVSRSSAGKNETLTKNKDKKQKRYLLDTMQRLHASFIEEFNVNCSYSYFSKQRPFYVVTPSIDGRETCLCKQHVNINYKLLALRKNRRVFTNNLSAYIDSIVCNPKKKICMFGDCLSCCTDPKLFLPNSDNSDTISWFEWVQKTEIFKAKKIAKFVKEEKQSSVESLKGFFSRDIASFKRHVFNIYNQFKAYRNCLSSLGPESVLLHIDWSENYSCKQNEEIQSHHFGGSRNQVALHTSVLYSRKNYSEPRKTESFCTVSPSLEHGPSAIWAHLHPILEYIRNSYPHAIRIHVFSDGPCTQYRQKKSFFLMSTKIFTYGFTQMTWSFFEAGHGKGAADGIGGVIKRTADRLVAHGKDITDATQFFEQLETATNVKMFQIAPESIKTVEDTVPTSLSPVPGTMRIHHITSDVAGKFKYSDLSCFCAGHFGMCNCNKPLNFSYSEIITESDDDDSIIDIPTGLKRTYANIYSSDSSDCETQPISSVSGLQNKENCSSFDQKAILEKNIPPGTFVLIKITSDKVKEYTYAACVQNEWEDAEVNVMYLRCTDRSKKTFRIEDKLYAINIENIVKILDNPSIKLKGGRVYYSFDKPVEEVFEQ